MARASPTALRGLGKANRGANPTRQMTLLIAALMASSPVVGGVATRYDPGVMEKVVENRLGWGQLDLSRGHSGYIAVADCKLLDELVWLGWPDGSFSGPHLVADCGAQHDQEYLDEIGFAVDLSYPLAVEHGVLDAPLPGVTVWLCDDFQWKHESR